MAILDSLEATLAETACRLRATLSCPKLVAAPPDALADSTRDAAIASGFRSAASVVGLRVVVTGLRRRCLSPLDHSDLVDRMPVHAPEMFAKNLFNFISPFIKEGRLILDWNDEVLAGTCLTHAGELRHSGVKQALGL